MSAEDDLRRLTERFNRLSEVVAQLVVDVEKLQRETGVEPEIT